MHQAGLGNKICTKQHSSLSRMLNLAQDTIGTFMVNTLLTAWWQTLSK